MLVGRPWFAVVLSSQKPRQERVWTASWGRHDGELSRIKWMNNHLEETIEDEEKNPSESYCILFPTTRLSISRVRSMCGMHTATLIGCTLVRKNPGNLA